MNGCVCSAQQARTQFSAFGEMFPSSASARARQSCISAMIAGHFVCVPLAMRNGEGIKCA